MPSFDGGYVSHTLKKQLTIWGNALTTFLAKFCVKSDNILVQYDSEA